MKDSKEKTQPEKELERLKKESSSDAVRVVLEKKQASIKREIKK